MEVVTENREAEERGDMNLLDAVWDLGPVRKIAKRMKLKRDKFVKLEYALERVDADGDGRTDVKELESWLQETDMHDMLGVTDVEELMSKFDADGNGDLDQDEVSALKRREDSLANEPWSKSDSGGVVGVKQDLMKMRQRQPAYGQPRKVLA